jgi:hypothetical protein
MHVSDRSFSQYGVIKSNRRFNKLQKLNNVQRAASFINVDAIVPIFCTAMKQKIILLTRSEMKMIQRM